MLILNQILALQRGSALNWADDRIQPITRGRFSRTVVLTFLFSLPSPTLCLPVPMHTFLLQNPLEYPHRRAELRDRKKDLFMWCHFYQFCRDFDLAELVDNISIDCIQTRDMGESLKE